MTQPAEKRGPGRRPAGEAKRGHAVRVQVTQAERAELAAWAAREGRPLAELLRDRGLRAARRSRPDDGLTEAERTGVIEVTPEQADFIADLVNNPRPAPRLRAAIKRHVKEPIVLAPNQYDALVERIENPPPANARMRAAAKARYNSTPPTEPWPERGTFAGSTSTPRPNITVMPWQDPPKRPKRRGA